MAHAGSAVILRNNQPRYVMLDSALEALGLVAPTGNRNAKYVEWRAV